MEFKGSHEMIVTQRAASQQAMATIRSISDAVVELVTNSDDSYRKIGADRKKTQGTICIFVHRGKRGKCKELKVTDFAQGMSKDELEKALEFGGETSGFEAGRSVRGLFGKGLKEVIIALGEGEIYTIKDNKLSAVKMWFDKGVTRYSDINELYASGEMRKEIGIEGDSGTVVKIKVKKDKISVPTCKTFKTQVERHYALRDINSSPERKIWLEFQSYKRSETSGANKITTLLQYSYPKGKLLFDENIRVPKYNDEIHLKIWESNTQLSSPRNNFSGEAGILVKTKGAILDNRLFKYENEPAALYFFGKAVCKGLEDRIREDFREHGGTGLIDPNRGGIEWRHEYYQMIQNIIEKILGPFVQEKKKELEKGIQRKEIPDATKKMLRKLCALLNRFAKSELIETEEKVELSEIDELTIKPEIANIEVDKPRTFSIYAPLDLISFGIEPLCKVESDNPNNIQRLTEDVHLSSHPEYPTLLYGTFKVVGRILGEKAILIAKLGEEEALAQVTVAPPKPKPPKGKPKIRKGGFISDIIHSEESNPSQRVLYKNGVVKIFIKFPVVAKYLDAGLSGVETAEGRTMLGELVGEAFCRAIARTRIKNGNPTPLSGDEGYIDAFNDVVNELQQKYLHEIHNLIANWKVK